MALTDLFGSRSIPLDIAEDIFHLAGPGALTSVRCTSKANAAAYSGVGLSMAKRGLWRCRVKSPELLQLAVEHRLPRLHITPPGIGIGYRLPHAATLVWLRELCIENVSLNTIRAAALEFLPRLEVLEINFLGLHDLPPLPATLKRLVWREMSFPRFLRRTGPLPRSLLYLQCNMVNLYLELPELPPFLQHLNINGTRLRSGIAYDDRLPTLPATLTHLSFNRCYSPRLPVNFPPALVHLACEGNLLISELPALPDTLEHLNIGSTGLYALPAELPPNLTWLSCGFNHLRRLPDLPCTLKHLECQHQQNGMEELPALHDTALVVLFCGDNGLTSLPTLPGTLRHLHGCGNAFTDEALAMMSSVTFIAW